METLQNTSFILRNAAHENFKKYAEQNGETFETIRNYATNKVDTANLLEPLEFYRRLYNYSIELLNDN